MITMLRCCLVRCTFCYVFEFCAYKGNKLWMMILCWWYVWSAFAKFASVRTCQVADYHYVVRNELMSNYVCTKNDPLVSCEFRHVQHVWPIRGPHKMSRNFCMPEKWKNGRSPSETGIMSKKRGELTEMMIAYYKMQSNKNMSTVHISYSFYFYAVSAAGVLMENVSDWNAGFKFHAR